MTGVTLLLLKPNTVLDMVGIIAAFAGAVSMATGTVLSHRWQPPISSLTFAAWQLTTGGLLLLPVALWLEPALPPLTQTNVAGLLYLSLIGAAFTYLLWFQGVARLDSSVVSSLGFLSPITAIILGWWVLGQELNPLQVTGMIIILGSIWLSQHAQRAKTSSVSLK